MQTLELSSKVHELRELRRMADELAAEIDAITDAIKAEMTARSLDELAGTDWKITWRAVKTNRIDAAALRRAFPDVAQAFTRETTTRRFCVA